MVTETDTSFLSGANAPFIAELYARYLDNPVLVDDSWRAHFDSLQDEIDTIRAEVSGPSWARQRTRVLGQGEAADGDAAPPAAADADTIRAATLDSLRAIMLIRAYRIRGHLHANLDPLALHEPIPHPELDPASYGFTETDWDRPIFIDNVLGLESATLRQIME
ncbi:MAG: 2-oxoglutarate dehydrogenase E1 subunit family protein, partial [Thalassobaculaceae bacterium]